MQAKQKKIGLTLIVIILLAIVAYISHSLLSRKNISPLNSKNISTTPPAMTAKEQTVKSQLFFSGEIAPLNVINIISPIDGTVSKLGFHYGQVIHKGQFLAEINSSKSENTYRDALTDYLKSKDTYINSRATYNSQQELYKDGLISRNDFESSRSQLENNQLGYRQAVYSLSNSINNITDNPVEQKNILNSLINLSLGDKSVDKALSLQFSKLTLRSESSGIALFPDKDSGSGSGTTVHQGGDIKAGAVLVAIGNLSGVSVDISANEIDINKIIPGQKVMVTGVAFPKEKLHGYVDTVGSQAKADMSGSGLPVFPVKVIVPNLTEAQQHIIHVGMTAEVTLDISAPKQIMIPIGAVTQTNQGNFVTIIRQGKKQTVSVITGQTTLTQIAIMHGLEPGDTIVKTH